VKNVCEVEEGDSSPRREEGKGRGKDRREGRRGFVKDLCDENEEMREGRRREEGAQNGGREWEIRRFVTL
jgi:hypothetical protein